MSDEINCLKYKTMTIRELAETIGCHPETIKGHIRELWPDLMANGVTTFLNEDQATAILEKMKQPVSSGAAANLQFQIAGTETNKSRALRIELLHRQMEAV
jgi:hypothetical protein